MSARKSTQKVRVAVIGGSGVYQIEGMKVIRSFRPKTPFGLPSDPITIGDYQGVRCAFLPRHGKGHRYLPSEIPQRANFYALKTLGVELVIALSACGSLKNELRPRSLVVPDGIVDRTQGRPSTFFGDGIVAHVGFAHPFSTSLSAALARAAREEGATVHEGGTYVCTEGPAFSARVESEMHRSLGFSIVGMTAMPEARFAREAEMAYAMLAMVTDYDCWKEGEEVSAQLVLENMRECSKMAKRTLARLLPQMGSVVNESADALRGAIFTDPAAIPAKARKRLGPIVSKYLG